MSGKRCPLLLVVCRCRCDVSPQARGIDHGRHIVANVGDSKEMCEYLVEFVGLEHHEDVFCEVLETVVLSFHRLTLPDQELG